MEDEDEDEDEAEDLDMVFRTSGRSPATLKFNRTFVSSFPLSVLSGYFNCILLACSDSIINNKLLICGNSSVDQVMTVGFKFKSVIEN